MNTAEIDEAKEKGFRSYLDNQQTKFLLSLIPQCDNPDTIQTVLRSAFEAGFGSGGGAFAVDMLKSVMAKRDAR